MAQVLDITSALQNAQNPDPSVRRQAEEQLSSFQASDLSSYLLSLGSELANNQKPAISRQLAGLLLKNSLDAPSEGRKVTSAFDYALGLITATCGSLIRVNAQAELNAQWQALDEALKQHIKTLLLSALAAEVRQSSGTPMLCKFLFAVDEKTPMTLGSFAGASSPTYISSGHCQSCSD